MDLSLIIAIFIILSLVITYLIKRFTKHKTFYILSLIKTKKSLPLFDKFAKLGKSLDIFADVGLILGFGAIAVDYLYLRKYKKAIRIPLFIISVIAISFLFILLDLMLNRGISTSPFTKGYFYIITIIFGLSGFAGFAIVTLVIQAFDILTKFSVGKSACPGVAPVIPGIEIPKVPIVVPLHAWISLLIILIIHEGMHGIVARRQKLKVKSSGVILLGFLPIAAFVEPDEREVAAAEPRKALRLFAAGPTANILAMVLIQIFVIFLVLILVTFVSPWAIPIKLAAVKGVEITKIDQNTEWCGTYYDSPAYGVLEEGMIIRKVNDRNVSTIADVQLERQQHIYEPITFLLEKDSNLIEKTLTPNELGMFGFTMENIPNEDYTPPVGYNLFVAGVSIFDNFIGWLFILNFLIAIVNFLPMLPFDGGRIIKIMLLPYFSFMKMSKEDTKKLIGRIFLFFILILLIINALPLFI